MRQSTKATILATAAAALLWASAAIATVAAEVPATSLAQYASGGHVLGFDSGGYYLSNGTYGLHVGFEGAQAVTPVGEASGSARGDAGDHTAAPLGRVTYSGLWRGISVTYDAPRSGIARSTWTIAPGADPAAIRLRYNRPLQVSESGDLGIAFETGVLTETRPLAWQDIDGRRQSVQVTFARRAADLIGFEVGAYRSDVPLTIDPTLSWNTFLGGFSDESGGAIAIDSNGDIYVAGSSGNTWGSPIRAYGGGGLSDAFVAKVSSSGTLLWNTFLGGASADRGRAVAVDSSDNVYVAGISNSTWGAPVRAYVGNGDAFVAKLTSSGALTWNAFLGGSGGEEAFALTVNATNVYVTGLTDNSWGPPLRPFGGFIDAFVSKLALDGTLTWNTCLGGSGNDEGFAIAVDSSGFVYVTGESSGTWGTSPIRTYTGNFDAFVARLTPAGALSWNTFLGDSAGDVGNGIVVDSIGNVDVVGYSESTWGTPVDAWAGSVDGFAAQLTNSGALVWNTFFGGSAFDSANAVVVDDDDNLTIGGYSEATWGTPELAFAAASDGFVAQVSSTGTRNWNTFLGAAGSDAVNGIVVAPSTGNIYAGGDSYVSWGTPVRSFSGSGGGNRDTFVARFGAAGTTPTQTPTQTPTSTATQTSTNTATQTPTHTNPASDTPTSTPTSTPTNTATQTPTRTSEPASCPVTPVSGCLTSAKGSLKLSTKPTDLSGAKDKLAWAFKGGPLLGQMDFGNPTATASYTLCIYDDNALALQAHIAASSTLWFTDKTKGYKYKDKLGSSDGITKAKLTGGDAGKSKLSIKGKGANLPPLNPLSGTQFFHAATAVVAQLRELNGDCYETAFAAAQVTKNTGKQLAAKK